MGAAMPLRRCLTRVATPQSVPARRVKAPKAAAAVVPSAAPAAASAPKAAHKAAGSGVALPDGYVPLGYTLGLSKAQAAAEAEEAAAKKRNADGLTKAQAKNRKRVEARAAARETAGARVEPFVALPAMPLPAPGQARAAQLAREAAAHAAAQAAAEEAEAAMAAAQAAKGPAVAVEAEAPLEPTDDWF
jgi:hypothetical protein